MAIFEKVDYGLVAQETFDVTFSGFGGQPIKAWLILPKQRAGNLPCVVEYIGYGGGRSFAVDWLLWSGRARVMPTSSWTHADREAPGPRVIRLICMPKVATPACPEA